MKIGYITMEKYENRGLNKVGSSRIRGRWVMKYCKQIEEYQLGVKYDAMIYQKAYWDEHMRLFDGIKIFDMCDPDWLDGRPLAELASLVDGFTVSTQALKEYIEQIVDKPVLVIPDRIDPEEHLAVKQKHVGKARSVVWFGYSQNFPVLDQCVDLLRAKGLQLVVISDGRYYQADVNIPYDYETLHEEIIKHDIVLMPSYPGNYRHKFKSNNKTLTAWALKMPVAKEVPDLDFLMDMNNRQSVVDQNYEKIMTEYHVMRSGLEYVDFIKKIVDNKLGGDINAK